MEFSVVKNVYGIKIYLDDRQINFKTNYCYLLGNIYNLDELEKFSNKLKIEDKIVLLYQKYQEDFFKKLNGEYAIFLVVDQKIILVRDRMGSKQIYYTKKNNEFIASTSLKFFINNRKKDLKIDKQILANYLSYSYIQEPNTIFKDIYKLESGFYLIYDKKLKHTSYYDLLSEYKNNRNKIKKEDEAEFALENSLKEAIKLRTKDKKKIGIYFSAGTDSTLICSLAKSLPDKEIHTYTIGFYEESRNEAKEAKKISNYLNTNHHEFYLDSKKALQIIKEIPKIYSEPFADPSLIPIIFLNQNVNMDMDIVLSGDGADQLFCGSRVYDDIYQYNFIKKGINLVKSIIYPIFDGDFFISKKNTTSLFFDVVPISYNCTHNLKYPLQVKYMLYDLKSFLANRLFSKVSFPAVYYKVNIAHPFVDNEVVDTTLKISHKYKYYHKEKKYILKSILYKKIPEDYFNHKKKGFGIPIKEWLYTIYKDDIIKYSNKEILKKQGLFPVDKISNEIDKLKNKTLNFKECYIMFSYYMFQLWYQEYIEDLWK